MSALAIRDLPDWPAAMTRPEALSYTRMAEAQLREWERRGLVRFRHKGANGAAVALRADLDAALRTLFESAADDEPIEFD